MAVAFDCPIVGLKAKSVLEVKQYPDNLNFKVWGFYSEDGYPTVSGGTLQKLYMDGAEYANEGTVWGAVGLKNYYWQKNGYLHFVAYAPAAPENLVASSVTAEGLQLSGYTIPDNADEDLLISKVAYQCTNPGPGVGAPLLFEHALSSITFKVKSDIYGDRSNVDPQRVDTDLRITKIEILQVRAEGDFSQQMTSWNNEQMDAPAVEKGWMVDESASTKDFTAYSAVKASTTGVVLTDQFQDCHDTEITDADTQWLTNLLLLPQQIKDDVILKVTYDMTHSNLADINGSAEPVWITGQTKTIKLNECGVAEWLRGNRYCYYITLSLNKIQCSTEVVEWDSYETLENLEDASIKDLNETIYQLK